MPSSGSQPAVPRIARAQIKVGGNNLSADVMNDLVSIEVDLSLDVPDMAVMRFHDQNTELTDGATFDVGKELEIQFADFGSSQQSPTPETVFKGEVVSLEPIFGDDGAMYLVVRGYSKLHRLSRGRKVRTFVQKTASDIVRQIAGENGLSGDVDSTTPVFEHVTQSNQTDLELVQMLARQYNYIVRVTDGKLVFKALSMSGTAVPVPWMDGLRRFLPRLSGAGQVNQMTVKAWDNKGRKSVVGQASSAKSNTTTGIGKTGAALAQSAFSPAKSNYLTQPTNDQGYANKMAQAQLDASNARAIEADGECFGNPKIVPGAVVEVTKVGRKFSGKYHITSATHRFNLEDGYQTEFRVEGATRQLISDLVAPAGSGGASATAATTSGFPGVVVGVVTNNDDPDGMGRVKVKYPWFDDSLESDWAYLVAAGAGKEKGFFVLPDVNDTVIVAFEMGDINRPLVLGGVWNQQDKPPVPGGDDVSGGSVKTYSFKTSSGHEIKFTDDSTSKIEIMDAKSKTSILLDGANSKLQASSKGDAGIDSTGDFAVDSKGKVSVKGQGGITIETTANLSIKGNMVSIEADSTLTLKGAVVNIN